MKKKGIDKRTGITHLKGGLGGIERCNKHGKAWKEGDNFERFGGKACEECIKNKTKKLSKCAFGHTVYLHYSGGSDTNPLPVCKVCGKIVI